MTLPLTTDRVLFSRLAWAGPLAVLGSVAGNGLVWAITQAIIPISPEFMPLATVGPTIFLTAVGALGAVGAFALVGRLAKQPRPVFQTVAAVALLVSLIPDVMLIVAPAGAPFQGITVPQVLALMVMHVVAYGLCVYVLTRFGMQRA